MVHASSNMPLRKNHVESVGQQSWTKPLPNEPEDGAEVANGEPATQKSDSSDEFDSKQASEFYSTEVKTVPSRRFQRNLL